MNNMEQAAANSGEHYPTEAPTSVHEARGRGMVEIWQSIKELHRLWGLGAYRPGELISPSGPILKITAFCGTPNPYSTEALISVEFENGVMTMPLSGKVRIFD